MDYIIDFTNKTVLITGAAGGIGSEIARAFLQNGADVVLSDYSEEQLSTKADALRTEFPSAKILTVCADITEDDGIGRISEFVKGTAGRADVLVNNAGIGHGVYSVNETREGWSRVLELNLSAQFFMSQRIVKDFMIPQSSGNIVNMCSLSAITGVPNAVAYSSSKGGLLQMTKSLAGEWTRYGIRVNCVCPGFVDTPLISDNTSNEKWMAYMEKRIPMHRIAVPEDIAGPVLFLASPLAQYINGCALTVDGGFLACS